MLQYTREVLYMEKERKVLTIRVTSDLKFQIEKATVEEGFPTVNSWVINVIKRHIENKNEKK